MTSTEFTVGLLEGTRVSSKVLKPPGGGSSDIFGLGNSHASCKQNSEKNQAKEDCSTHSRVFGVSNAAPPVNVNLQAQSNSQCNILENGNRTPAKPGKKVFVRRNPITGEEIEICLDAENDTNTDNKDAKEEESANNPFKPVQTSIRVRNPPGGKSSGIF